MGSVLTLGAIQTSLRIPNNLDVHLLTRTHLVLQDVCPIYLFRFPWVLELTSAFLWLPKQKLPPCWGKCLYRHPVRLPLNLLFLKSARCLKNQLQKFVCPVICSTCHLYLLSDKLTEKCSSYLSLSCLLLNVQAPHKTTKKVREILTMRNNFKFFGFQLFFNKCIGLS